MPILEDRNIAETDITDPTTGNVIKTTAEHVTGVSPTPRNPFDVRDEAAVMFYKEFAADVNLSTMSPAEVDAIIYRSFAKADTWMKARGRDPSYPTWYEYGLPKPVATP